MLNDNWGDSNTDGYRWKNASRVGKWTPDADIGYNRSSELPDFFKYFVENQSTYEIFNRKIVYSYALPEIEWCNMHCRGRFTRRSSKNKQSSALDDSSLNIMAFELERDFSLFSAYQIVHYNTPWMAKISIFKVESGWAFLIPKFSNDIDIMCDSWKPTKDHPSCKLLIHGRAPALCYMWCLENCEPNTYCVSDNSRVKFLFFEKEEDAVLFKFTFILPMVDR